MAAGWEVHVLDHALDGVALETGRAAPASVTLPAVPAIEPEEASRWLAEGAGAVSLDPYPAVRSGLIGRVSTGCRLLCSRRRGSFERMAAHFEANCTRSRPPFSWQLEHREPSANSSVHRLFRDQHAAGAPYRDAVDLDHHAAGIDLDRGERDAPERPSSAERAK